MIENFVALIATFAPMWSYVLNHLMMLMFVATVPAILRRIIRG